MIPRWWGKPPHAVVKGMRLTTIHRFVMFQLPCPSWPAPSSELTRFNAGRRLLPVRARLSRQPLQAVRIQPDPFLSR
jgi:hypothetical protein